jgi:heme-degrading monooxygenase HmoA
MSVVPEAVQHGIAVGLQPPYYAVIFTSRRTDGDNGYGAASDAMVELAAQQQGFLGIETARGADGVGITVSYWDSEEAIAGWRRNVEHRATRERGRSLWYQHYEVRVCRVERAYAGPPART